MTDLPSDTEPSDGTAQGHPAYANAGQAETRPAGSYAEGSRRAAAESARLNNGRPLERDSQRALDDAFVDKLLALYTNETMLKYDGQMFVAATQIRLFAIIAKRLGEIGGRT